MRYVRVMGCASRGRGDNGTFEQDLQLNHSTWSNCLTTVQKDSMVAFIYER